MGISSSDVKAIGAACRRQGNVEVTLVVEQARGKGMQEVGVGATEALVALAIQVVY